MTLKEKLGKEWIFFDGGSGTLLQEKGLKGGEQPEGWNLTHPEAVRELYAGYLKAGADVFNTNTFGANRFHYGENLKDVILEGVKLAKEARKEAGREEDAYIALDIGPTGKLLSPMGDLPFEDAVNAFAEVVRIGADAGADLVLIETMSDAYEAKAALLAAKENCDLPVIVTCTFDRTGRLLTGGTVRSLVPMLEGLGADAVGINCSLGPEEMLPLVREFVETASVPVIVNPNAGLPETREGKTVYPTGPEAFAAFMKEIALLGVQGVGGCCGTTPEHIRLLKETVSPLPFRAPVKKDRLIVSSGSLYTELSADAPCAIVGERINPTGKKRFQRALKEKDLSYILSQAIEQEDAGADILDVNVGMPGIDEPEMMETVIRSLQAVTMLPLQIDSSDPEAIGRALRIYNGRPLLNSVSGKEESLRTVLPLAKKYGAAVVALCLDENGIPKTAEGRLAVAEKILSCAKAYGIDPKDVIIDGLTMTVSAEPDGALTTLKVVKEVEERLHCRTILGVSNVSFGLPGRSAVNAAFLSMAVQSGLSLAIMNPNDLQMLGSLRAANALLKKDENCLRYIETFADVKTEVKAVRAGISENTGGASGEKQNAEASLETAVIRGLTAGASEETKRLLKAGVEPLRIIEEHLVTALNAVGEAYETGRLYLPQLLMSADAAKASFAVLKDAMTGKPQKSRGTVLLATVKGDIHDIGKNIVRVMLENYGYTVADLGKDVDPETVAAAAEKERIRLVGLSALMTTTVPSMEETIRLLRQRVPDVKIMVGGAVLTEEYAKRIGADAYGRDAMAAVRYADSVFRKE